MARYTVEAHNSAATAENKIHDDTVARALGFRGGLVPGADLYAYLCRGPALRWGRTWLEHGTMRARFVSPVYDGDTVAVDVAEPDDGLVALQLRNVADGATAVCASGWATLQPLWDGAAPDFDLASVDVPPAAPLPLDRPVASAESLRPGTVLGSLALGFHAARAGEYLDEIREDLALFRRDGLAHPGWLLRQANYVLASNVRLGPWIHVASDARHFAAVEDGARLSVRAVVTDAYERKGHKFVELDVVFADADADAGAGSGTGGDHGRVYAAVHHTAIYEPRGAAAAADQPPARSSAGPQPS
jgi:hypothetical protein